MILKLAEALDMPLRARNEMLLAAGFAPYYPERPLDAPGLKAVLQVLQGMLDHHEPYPALVLDRAWNVVLSNAAVEELIHECVTDEVLNGMRHAGQLNFLRLLCAPEALRKNIRSWPRTGRALLGRLRREAAAYPGSPSEALLQELTASNAFPQFMETDEAQLDATIPLEIEVKGARLRLLTTITTFGTAQDVTLQELRIEMSYPADEETERVFTRPRGA